MDLARRRRYLRFAIAFWVFVIAVQVVTMTSEGVGVLPMIILVAAVVAMVAMVVDLRR